MIELKINENASNQRLDRYLFKLLPLAKKSLIQKSIRNKNITLNNKKAAANTLLRNNDTIQIYFSDDTIEKFKGQKKEILPVPKEYLYLVNRPLYEDENFVIVNKPVNLLTQPDKTGDLSLAEIIKIKIPDEDTFKSAPLNRLDRNTTGIVIFPKNYHSQKTSSEAIREKNSDKIYHAVVDGFITQSGELEDLFSKDSEKNIVHLGSGSEKIKLEYKPLKTNGKQTLLEIKLHTGKSHQIRSQLSNAGYPIIGDNKYGNKKINQDFKEQFGINSQLLHAYNYRLYDKDNNIILDVTAPDPEVFNEVLS